MRLLFPRTDLAVLVQLIVTILAGAPVVYVSWRRGSAELTWFAGGVVVLLLGLFAIRTVH